jgi:glycosyltransferase involved in cell wall biosynthesis
MHSLERSGMEMMLLNSSRAWNQLGYQCDVLATTDQAGPLAQQMRESGYQVFHIPFRSQWRYLPRMSFVHEFYALCKSGYDVVHFHIEAAALLSMLAKLAGVRRIAVTPHGVFNFRGALRLRKLCERQFIRLLGGRFGMISEAVSRCEWERFRIKGVRISNWLDTEYFRPPSAEERARARSTLAIDEKQFVIVSVGNCSPLKNHDSILRALPLLSESSHPLYLHVGREDMDASEQKLADELGISDGVRFLGSQADPLPILWAADVFVMPSLSEGLGMAALEAAASGVPLVCTRVEGLSNIAAQTRWAVPISTSAESVAQGIAEVAAVKPLQRRERGLADSQIVRAQYPIRKGVESIVLGLYA